MKVLIAGIFLVATTVALIGAGPQAAPEPTSQQVCVAHEVAIEQLKDEYSEQVKGRGLTDNAQEMVEVFTSNDGSWTVLITDVDGRSCVVLTGESWHKVSPLFEFAA